MAMLDEVVSLEINITAKTKIAVNNNNKLQCSFADCAFNVYPPFCTLFKKDLKFDLNSGYDFRCQECLDAENGKVN